MSFSVYIHLPFCATRCNYCDFVSCEMTNIPFDDYIEAVHREWAVRAALFEEKCLSVYVGGGTPSLWPAQKLSQLLSPFALSNEIEVTVELNPGDCNVKWLEAIASCGVNRLSVGVQSLDDDRLRWLGRRHDAAEAQRAIVEAIGLGAFSVSADIIYGTPGHNVQLLSNELVKLADLGLDHISAYELTVAPNTPLGKRAQQENIGMPNSDEMVALWLTVGTLLSKYNLERYEVSSYARPKHKSRHNEHYWQGGQYAGLGAGAHGFTKGSGGMIRYANTADVSEYMSTPCNPNGVDGIGKMGFTEKLTALQHAFELIMLGLRTTNGVCMRNIASLITQNELSNFNEVVYKLKNDGFVTVKADRIYPSIKGLLNADLITAQFF